MTDERFIITADEAESLLNEGDTIHNFLQSGAIIIGCDYDRANAIRAFRDSELIEIGGDACKRMKHPIVVHEKGGRYTFFEADMAKVDALEAARSRQENPL